MRTSSTPGSLVELAALRRLPGHQYMDRATAEWIAAHRPAARSHSPRAVLRPVTRALVRRAGLPHDWLAEPRLADSIHGVRHGLRTAALAAVLAEASGLGAEETAVAVVAAAVHDCRRHHDRDDPGHGARAADWLTAHADTVWDRFGLGPPRPANLFRAATAVRLHDVPYGEFAPAPGGAPDALTGWCPADGAQGACRSYRACGSYGLYGEASGTTAGLGASGGSAASGVPDSSAGWAGHDHPGGLWDPGGRDGPGGPEPAGAVRRPAAKSGGSVVGPGQRGPDGATVGLMSRTGHTGCTGGTAVARASTGTPGAPRPAGSAGTTGSAGTARSTGSAGPVAPTPIADAIHAYHRDRVTAAVCDIVKAADALDRYRLPKTRWWPDGRRIRVPAFDAFRPLAFELVVVSERAQLAGADGTAAVLYALAEKDIA